jgi:HemY protein
MIWSLVKVAVFVALAALLAWAAGYVIETPGQVTIAFGGREVLLQPFDFVLALAAAFALFWLVLKLAGFLVAVIRFFNGDETAFSRYLDRNYERRGSEAIVQSMIALAAGEGREAQRHAEKAASLIDRPEMTRLLLAQSAELAGNRGKAEAEWKALVADPKTRFIGIQGLLRQKLDAGETALALKLAEKAFAVKPSHPGVLDTLFALQAEASDWPGARETLEAKVKARLLPRDVGARRDAVLSLAEARAAEIAGDLDRACRAAADANRLAPALVPAAVTAARLKAGEGDRRAAERILKKAWDIEPHPDLSAAFAALETDESPAARQKRFKALLASRPEHPETRLLAAELSLSAEDFPAARRALGDLAETRPTARTLAITAAVARGEGEGDAVVRGWLARALSASRGEHWVCSKCRHVHSGWVPICENCEAFDTLAWELPPASDRADLGPAAMLPLLVGSASAPAAEAAPEPPAAPAAEAAAETPAKSGEVA